MTATIEDFAGWIGEECNVEAGGVHLPMRLLAAEPIAGSLRDGGGFRLEFEGPRDPILPQSIMQVTKQGEPMEIFMVPVGRDANGVRYEAIFI